MEINSVQRVAVTTNSAPSELPPEKLAENRELIQAVKAVNHSGIMGQDSELNFQLDRESRQIVLRIVDRKTKETLLQVPPEYVLQLARDFGDAAP